MSIVRRIALGPAERAGRPDGTGILLDPGPSFIGSSARRTVTVEAATGIAAVWAAVWLIAEQVGSLPLSVYRKRGDSLEPAVTWQSRLLAAPNAETTPVDLWTTLVLHLELWGRAYVGKERTAGMVTSLWLIPPDRVTVRRDRGRKMFDVVTEAGDRRTYTAADVIHVKGRSLDGYEGVSPITLHRETIGTALALDEFGGQILGNRGVPQGVLRLKHRLTSMEARDQIRAEWDRRTRGGNRGSAVILDEGAEFQPITMPLADAQYVEQRRLTVQEIARIFGVPAELIGGDSGASLTYSNIESRSIDLLRYTLRARMTRIEQALFADPDLFPNRGGLLPRFDTDDLYRGDRRSQYETLAVATGRKAFMTTQEARDRAGLPPLSDEDAAALTPPAVAPAPSAPNDPDPDPPAGVVEEDTA